MGDAMRKIVAESATGWWGRLGLWVARTVFRLETASRIVPAGSFEPVRIVEGSPRTRDYILVGMGADLAGHDLSDAADYRRTIDADHVTTTPEPAAATVVDVIITEVADTKVPISEVAIAEQPPVETLVVETPVAAPVVKAPIAGVMELPETATDGAEPMETQAPPAQVPPIRIAVASDADTGNGKPVDESIDVSVKNDRSDSIGAPSAIIHDERMIPCTDHTFNGIPGHTQTPVNTVEIEQQHIADVVGVDTVPVEAGLQEDDVVATSSTPSPTPASDDEISMASISTRPNRQERRTAKRQALKPLRTRPVAEPQLPVMKPMRPDETIGILQDEVAVAPAPTIEEAEIEDAVIDLPQEVVTAQAPDDSVDATNNAPLEPIAATAPRRQRTLRSENHNAPVEEPTLGFANAINMHHVLDRLPRYFEHLRMLRNVDADAYTLFAKLGGQIALSDGTRFSKGGISPEFLANPPQVRCVFLHSEVDENGVTADDMIPASIIYMMRLAGGQICVNGQSIAMIPQDGLTYRYVTVFEYKGKPYVESCFVHIDDEGTVKALPERLQVKQAIAGRHRKNSPTTVRHNKVAIPGWIRSAAHDRGETPEQWITNVVSICASAKRPDDAILVRAHKAGLAAAWTINRRDAKRFFAAREVDEAGKRRRVLHYVGSFDRMTAGGVQSVREHYRGAREFEWQGYDIEVSGLNFHHKDFFEAPIEQIEEDGETQVHGSLVSLKKAVRGVVEHYRAPFSLSKGRRKAA